MARNPDHASALLLLWALALPPAAGCTEEAPHDAAGCSSDLDCTAGQICQGGVCSTPQQTGCTLDEECTDGKLCVDGSCVAPTSATPCTAFVDPICPAGQLCTLTEEGSCPAPPCVARFACRAPIGETQPLYPCVDGADCSTGTCSDGSCLRACQSNHDCPGGYACEAVVIGSRTVDRCVGTEEGIADPGIVRCDNQADCPEDRDCRFFASASGADVMTPACRVPDPTRTLASGAACTEDRGRECVSGACLLPCSEPEQPVCQRLRCATPCSGDSFCEAPFRCVSFYEERTIDGRPMRHCALPILGCLDQLDCCREGEGCTNGWPMIDGVCAVVARSDGGVTSDCIERPPGSLALAAPCAQDSECASGLCITPPTGAQATCSSPCIPADDRCDRIRAGTVCTVIRGETPATLVHACR